MVGFALFGCGRIGRMHARNVAEHPRSRLVACYDRVGDAAAEVAARHGAEAVPSVEAALGHPDVEAVLIASTTDTHVDLITAAAKAGKPVLCEKPVDLDIARVDACWAEIAGLDPLVMIGFNRRFDPAFRAVRDRVLAGEIGVVEQIVITSRDPAPPPPGFLEGSGGLFRDLTIHDLDMARFFLGEVVEVSATAANLVSSEIAEAGDTTSAAIAPPLAAEIYGLDILARDVEDEDHNTTRFVELSREPRWPAAGGPTVTTFVFNVRNLPAALYKALGGFATNGVNMTKLESYMVDGTFNGATQFLAEVDGHPDDVPVARALEELAFFTTDVTMLGVYPADPFRSSTR